MYEVDKLHGWLPKIIHQTYPDRQLPSCYKQNIFRIKQLNPGWDYRFYDDEDIKDYIARNFPEVLDYYHRIDKRYGVAKADLFRYLLIYNEGGIYLDIKSTVTRPLDEVVPSKNSYLLSHWKNGPDDRYAGYGLLACEQDRGGNWPERGEYQQWFIVAPPGHPFLRKTIDKVCENIDRYCPLTGEVGRVGVLKLTGPIAYTQAILSLKDMHPHSIIDSEDDLGLCYSFLPAPGSHEKSFRGKHYSRQKRSIITPRGIKSLVYPFKILYGYLAARVENIKKSIFKRTKRLTVVKSSLGVEPIQSFDKFNDRLG
jgi:mannosyltransferase OCH1-like enzyme